jgi:hypothetical protein
MCRMPWKSGSLNLLEPSGPHRDSYGTPPIVVLCIVRSFISTCKIISPETAMCRVTDSELICSKTCPASKVTWIYCSKTLITRTRCEFFLNEGRILPVSTLWRHILACRCGSTHSWPWHCMGWMVSFPSRPQYPGKHNSPQSLDASPKSTGPEGCVMKCRNSFWWDVLRAVLAEFGLPI